MNPNLKQFPPRRQQMELSENSMKTVLERVSPPWLLLDHAFSYCLSMMRLEGLPQIHSVWSL